jgi:hypothetical protein
MTSLYSLKNAGSRIDPTPVHYCFIQFGSYWHCINCSECTAVTQYCARIDLDSGLQLFITEKFRNISTRAELMEIYLLLSIFKHTVYAQI